MRRVVLALFVSLFTLPALAATAWVTEFNGAPPQSVYYQAVRAPALATQSVAVGGASTPSAVFNASTGIVRVSCDVACLVEIGPTAVAVATSMRLAAGGVEYFVVPLSSGYRVAVLAAPAP